MVHNHLHLNTSRIIEQMTEAWEPSNKHCRLQYWVAVALQREVISNVVFSIKIVKTTHIITRLGIFKNKINCFTFRI
jgi:hypothetical protein